MSAESNGSRGAKAPRPGRPLVASPGAKAPGPGRALPASHVAKATVNPTVQIGCQLLHPNFLQA